MTLILDKIGAIIGANNLTTDPQRLQDYGQDWTRFYQPRPLAVAFPSTTEQISRLVRLANQDGLAIVPSGGRTGMSGGAVAGNGELVVALDRMSKILDLNPTDRTITCQAGVITKNVQDYAEQHGFFYPVNFASAGSSQIGGNIATNAGGIRVIRYGSTRDWVAGLEMVTGTGEILTLNNGLQKNNAGYALHQLVIGSEGTLGIITEATLKLTTPPRDLTVLLIGVPNVAAALNVLEILQQQCSLTAFEFFTDPVMQLTLSSLNKPNPLSGAAPVYLLVEIELLTLVSKNHLLSQFDHCLDKGWVVDGILSENKQQFQDLWRLREHIPEVISRLQPYRNDLAVRTSLLAEFIAEADAIARQREPEIQVAWFGHAGDGNVHYDLLKPENWTLENFVRRAESVMAEIFSILEKYHGSVAAEHGIGLLKKPYLRHTRTEQEIALMRQIKTAFDPNGVLNPGKIFD